MNSGRGITRKQKIPWLRLGAESIAIVGSILLAFAIDAWYDESQDRRLAADYEQRIHEELIGARAVLSYHSEGFKRSIEASEYASAYFDDSEELIDGGRLVAALYYMGLDPLRVVDLSTHEDLISTGRLGLISDVTRRAAAQRAYRFVERAETLFQPYRDEYLREIRAWIPRRIQQRLRDACVGRVGIECSDVVLDSNDVDAILAKIASDEAVQAFRLREQGLITANSLTDQAIEAVDDALQVLE